MLSVALKMENVDLADVGLWWERKTENKSTHMAYSITLNQHPIHFFHRHYPVITHLWWESLCGQERPLRVA